MEETSERSELREQATLFAQHILGSKSVTISPHVEELYETIMKATIKDVSAHDKKLLAVVTKHPRLLPYIDGGIALSNPDSELRRRLYVMFAVLESTPDYWQYFLPVKRSDWYILAVAGSGIRSAWRGVIGYCVVKVVA